VLRPLLNVASGLGKVGIRIRETAHDSRRRATCVALRLWSLAPGSCGLADRLRRVTVADHDVFSSHRMAIYRSPGLGGSVCRFARASRRAAIGFG